MLRGVTLLWELQKAAIRSELQYRLNFAFLALLGVLYQASGIAFVWVVLRRFDSIAGWTFGEVALLYAMRMLAHALWVVPFHQLAMLDTIIREGRFDRYLVRPLNPLLQIITTRFRLNVLGDLAAAVALLVIALSQVDVEATVPHVVYFVLAVVGGALAEGAVVIAVSSLAFRFIETWAATHLVDNVFLLFGSYPTRLFGTAANWALTWLLPIAFVAYVPSSLLLDRTDELTVPPVVAWLAPVVGMLWFTAAYRFWRRQIRGYQSVGN